MHNRITLSSNGAHLDAYIEESQSSRDGILIIPGGGYYDVCESREGSPIAKAFLNSGINAFVLTYNAGNDVRFPSHLKDAALAMKYIKDNAKSLFVNPERIFVLGFSAGAHLAGTLSVMHKEAEDMLGITRGLARPAATVYCYPVVSAYQPTHSGSFYYLTGKNPEDMNDSEKDKYSIEKRVNSDTPPAFIWHTVDDQVVPVYGSLKLLNSYINAGVTVSAHIYPTGPHGMALANSVTSDKNPDWENKLVAGWFDYAVDFLKTV